MLWSCYGKLATELLAVYGDKTDFNIPKAKAIYFSRVVVIIVEVATIVIVFILLLLLFNQVCLDVSFHLSRFKYKFKLDFYVDNLSA